jgi:hypothetical protein
MSRYFKTSKKRLENRLKQAVQKRVGRETERECTLTQAHTRTLTHIHNRQIEQAPSG